MHVVQPNFIRHINENDKDKDKTKGPQKVTIFSLAISPDNRRLATVGLDQKVKIWDTEPILNEDLEQQLIQANKTRGDDEKKSIGLLCTLGNHTGNVLCVRWSPDGSYLATGSDDNIAIVWERDAHAVGRKVFGQTEENLEVWKPAHRLVAHESDVGGLAWSPDGYYLASCSTDSTVIVWDAEDFRVIKHLTGHKDMVKGVAFDPAGEFLATQSDDRSVLIWNTADWRLIRTITDPFIDSPNLSWFRRLSWSPEGAFLAIPNCVNNGVFVAGLVKRREWGGRDNDLMTSLVGHDSGVDVTCFNPRTFLNSPNKPATPSNFCSILAVAAKSTISIWKTSVSRPILVLDTILDREILDLSWSQDGTTLYACSSDGNIAVMLFSLEELGHPAPAGTTENYLASVRTTPAPRALSAIASGSRGPSAAGTSDRPNMLQVKRGRSRQSQSSNASSALLPIPPFGAPQQVTRLPNGRRRITPTFLGSGGLGSLSRESSLQSIPEAPQRALFRPPIEQSHHAPLSGQHRPAQYTHPDERMELDDPRDMRAIAGPSTVRSQLQGIGVPSWGVPQDRAATHISNQRKRKAIELDGVHADEYMGRSLTTSRPSGRTLGGDRAIDLEPYDGEIVELRPAYIPKTRLIEVPREDLTLAVPSIKAKVAVKWDYESEDPEVLEYRNWADPARASEVALKVAGQKVQWLDYLPSFIISVAFTPHFTAVACEDRSLQVYSPTGRRLLPTMVLDSPCSFLDASGNCLLAITSRGTLSVWEIRKRKAVFRPSSVYPIIAQSSDALPNAKSPIITSAKVRPNGSPVISLSNGTALGYDGDLEAWAELCTGWWSKGSEFWEKTTVRASSTVGRGVVGLLERETNDWLLARQTADEALAGNGGPATVDGEIAPLRDSIEGQEQVKLGNEDDWKTALALGHLENRMHAAIALDSIAEYRSFLREYARKLGEESFRGKAEELVKDLIGPIYHKPGREDVWSTHLLGVHKHTLLRDEVLLTWKKYKSLSKLVSDTNDTLRRMVQDV